jgi:hypothetical protein
MLGSGADFSLGGTEFMLATDLGPGEEAYIHQYENAVPDQSKITGINEESPNPSLRFWKMNSWLAGEGLDFYNEEQPARYLYARANTRVPGAIQSPPVRTAGDTETTSATPTKGWFVAAGSRLWFFASRNGYWSTNGTTWTENTAIATAIAASGSITGATYDGDDPIIAITTSTGVRRLYRVTSTTAVVQLTTNTGASAPTFKALAMVEGQIYCFTGGRVLRYNSTDDNSGAGSIPFGQIGFTDTTSSLVYPMFKEEPAGSLYHDATSGETSAFFLKGGDGQAVIHEFKNDVSGQVSTGRPIWKMPLGFTAEYITVSLGILYVVGQFNGRCALFGMSTVNRQPLFLGYFGEDRAVLNVRFIQPSYGAQVLIGADDGTTSYIFIYDAEEDAFSELDERTIAADGTMLSGTTWKNQRITATFSGTTLKFHSWAHDKTTPANGFEFESTMWDFGRPEDQKTLFGIQVTQDPSLSGTVGVYYQDDEDGVWTLAGTTSASTMNNYINIAEPTADTAATVKFRTLRIRLVGTGACRVFSVVPRVYVNALNEVWRLVVDLRNMPGTNRKPSNKSVTAAKQRAALLTLIEGKTVSVFKDGRRFSKKSNTNDEGYTTHVVVPEFPQDAIDSAGEGKTTLILRSVTPA